MVQVSGRRVSLIDWRGFEAQDTKAISGRGCRFGGGGGCLRGSVAGATRGDGNGRRGGHWTGSRLTGEFVGAEDAVSYGGAGADCDCVVSVPGAHPGARPNRWIGGDGPREDGVEGVRGARQRKIQHQEDRAVDGEHSPYAADGAERERAIAFSKQWIDAAVAIGSPSVRTNIPPAKDSKPDLERTAESLKRVAEYGAAKNVVVNLENDNGVSEDPYFLVKVIEKVNSKWLYALPDFGNSLAAYEEEYAYWGIDGMFSNAYNISHVKETEVGEKGKIARVDLAKTFGIAKRHGYKGYFSMEWDSPGDPYAGTAGLIEKTLQNLS